MHWIDGVGGIDVMGNPYGFDFTGDTSIDTGSMDFEADHIGNDILDNSSSGCCDTDFGCDSSGFSSWSD